MANFKNRCQMLASINDIALFGTNWEGTILLERLPRRQRPGVPRHGWPLLPQAGGV